MMYSAKPHLNLESPCLKSACNLETADPHCAEKDEGYFLKVSVSMNLWLAREGILLSVSGEYQTAQDEGWREIQASQTAPIFNEHWADAMSLTCDIKWQLRKRQPMVSQKLPQRPLYALLRFFVLFSPNTSSMDTITQWWLEDEGGAMVGRQRSHHFLLTSTSSAPHVTHREPVEPLLPLPWPPVERWTGDLTGSLALSTLRRGGTITELTMLQVTQVPSVIIPKTDGRLWRNSLLIQGTRDCVAALRKPIQGIK